MVLVPMDCEKNYIHELLVRLKQGNIEASESLLVCFSNVFYQRAVGKYQLSHEDAQDAVQQTFFRIIDGGINSYDEKKRGGPRWMWRIFGNVVIDQIRKTIKQRGRDVSLDELLERVENDILAWELSEEMNPEQSVIIDEDNEALYKAVHMIWENLSEAERKAIIKGRGTGPGRKEYWVAAKRARALFEEYYGPVQGS